MHWATKTKKEPAIEAGESNDVSREPEFWVGPEGQDSRNLDLDGQEDSAGSRVFWTRNEGTDMLKKFRNYEI